jgi:serine/threonine-protein kinase
MSDGQKLHPTPEQLHDFALGRLSSEQMAMLEQHVALCDSCCLVLSAAPEDTLLQLAREAATLRLHADRQYKPTPPNPPDIPPELVDHARYRVLGLIGSGGMGAVYKAQHRLMDRLVALKVISPAFLQNQAAVERFRREFRAIARLSHPNIVTAFDAEQSGDLHFLVMEFVEGLSLDQLVAQRGPLEARPACDLFRQAALGLSHVHERGMVHRDIKPQNLMVGRQGTLKILDCGLARLSAEPLLEAAERQTVKPPLSATQAGMMLGTPDYMSPEQCRNAAQADGRSDIYSLGCTLFFALTGRPPFSHRLAMEKLLAHAQEAPPPVRSLRPDVPDQVARIIDRMLAKDPAQRYQMAAEVATDLAAAMAGAVQERLPPPATPVATAEPPPAVLPAIDSGDRRATTHLPRRPRWLLPLVAAFVLALGALAGIPLCLAWLRPDDARGSASAGAALPRKVLLVIPRYGLWYADYEDVKQALEKRSIEVVTASSELAASDLVPKSRRGVAMPDLVLDRSINAADYGAVVFAGLATEEYHPGTSTGNTVALLLEDCQAQQRLITAICGGQKALAAHGRLAGKRVARSDYAQHTYSAAGAIPQENRVQRDGLIITGAADTDAAAFADLIATALR